MTSQTTAAMLQAAIVEAFPEHSQARFTLLTSGYDCIAVDVDDRVIFKFPRNAAAREALIFEASALAVVRRVVTLPVPNMTLHCYPRLFSRHVKLKGEHLLTMEYELLPVARQRRLALDMALFYSQLHGLSPSAMEAIGAGPVKAWLLPEDILRRVRPVLPDHLRLYAEETLSAWQQLPPDPHGVTYGFFDGHGWNMAYDHESQKLNGIYDFADSGFGALHQEFIYSNWISPQLTALIVPEYEALTGRALDRQRIDLLTGVHRLSELAQDIDNPKRITLALHAVAGWASAVRRSGCFAMEQSPRRAGIQKAPRGIR